MRWHTDIDDVEVGTISLLISSSTVGIDVITSSKSYRKLRKMVLPYNFKGDRKFFVKYPPFGVGVFLKFSSWNTYNTRNLLIVNFDYMKYVQSIVLQAKEFLSEKNLRSSQV